MIERDRRPVSPRLRFLVLQRDGFRCRYCGRSANEVALHVDHVVARAQGGRTEEGNLITACETCNIGKSSSALLFVEDQSPGFDRSGDPLIPVDRAAFFWDQEDNVGAISEFTVVDRQDEFCDSIRQLYSFEAIDRRGKYDYEWLFSNIGVWLSISFIDLNQTQQFLYSIGRVEGCGWALIAADEFHFNPDIRERMK